MTLNLFEGFETTSNPFVALMEAERNGGDMQEVFDEMLTIKDVTGVMLISLTGDMIYSNFEPGLSKIQEDRNWFALTQTLDDIKEAELVYRQKRIYIRKTEVGFLVVLMGLSASTSMVRLNCDVLMPLLADVKAGGKGLKGFFKRK